MYWHGEGRRSGRRKGELMQIRNVVPPHRALISVAALAAVYFGIMGRETALGITAQLQGQSTNSSVWIAGNLLGWGELDLIPSRVFFSAGPASNVAVEVTFDHSKSTGSSFFPGIQNLLNFTASNVVFNSGPTQGAGRLESRHLVVHVQ